MKSYLIEIQNGAIVTPIPGYTDEQTENGTAKAGFFYACSVASAPERRNVPATIILLEEDGHKIKEEKFIPPTETQEE